MKRILGLFAVAILVAAIPTIAGDAEAKAGQEVQLTGYFTDEWCGAANANEKGAGCAKACAKKGSAMAILADGKMYKVNDEDKQTAVDNVGQEVVVNGTILEDGTLKIGKVEKAEAKS